MYDNSQLDKILDGLVKQTEGYANTYRKSISATRYSPDHGLDYNDENILEPLLEHVGQLPITAAYLFQYLNDTDLDLDGLGRTLTMLAVHDIGELEHGDILTFQKTDRERTLEDEAAYAMVGEKLKPILEEFNDLSSKPAQFAMSCDKLVADILELLIDPGITNLRYKDVMKWNSPAEIVTGKREKKAKHMEWNEFLNQLYERLLWRLQKHLEG